MPSRRRAPSRSPAPRPRRSPPRAAVTPAAATRSTFLLLLPREFAWRVGLLALGAFALHWWGSRPLREVLGLATSDASGPFTTLVGLLCSVVLGHMYAYYFDRQGAIQDAVFEEAAALARLGRIIDAACATHGSGSGGGGSSGAGGSGTGGRGNIAAARAEARGLLRRHAAALLSLGLSAEARLDGSLFGSTAAVRRAGGHDAAGSAALLAAALAAVRDVDRAAAKRVSEINADLPDAHWWTMYFLSLLLLGSFLIEDGVGQPLGATLFAGVSASAALFYGVLSDVRNPFGGSWSVGAARQAVSVVLDALADHGAEDGGDGGHGEW